MPDGIVQENGEGAAHEVSGRCHPLYFVVQLLDPILRDDGAEAKDGENVAAPGSLRGWRLGR